MRTMVKAALLTLALSAMGSSLAASGCGGAYAGYLNEITQNKSPTTNSEAYNIGYSNFAFLVRPACDKEVAQAKQDSVISPTPITQACSTAYTALVNAVGSGSSGLYQQMNTDKLSTLDQNAARQLVLGTYFTTLSPLQNNVFSSCAASSSK